MRWRAAMHKVSFVLSLVRIILIELRRCQKLDKQCIFFNIPKDPVSE